MAHGMYEGLVTHERTSFSRCGDGVRSEGREFLLPRPHYSRRRRKRGLATNLISQKVCIKLFCKRQFPHKFVNLSLFIANAKDKLTDLCGNRLMQNDVEDTFCEIELLLFPRGGAGRGVACGALRAFQVVLQKSTP